MDEITVKIEGGDVVLRKPLAGQRNQALVKADLPEGFKRSVMMIEMLPTCIKSHPWGMNQIRASLDRLSIEDYDKLIDGLEQLMGKGEELKKKLNDTSAPSEQEKSGSSDSSLTITTSPSK